jgi:hypothetical protein
MFKASPAEREALLAILRATRGQPSSRDGVMGFSRSNEVMSLVLGRLIDEGLISEDQGVLRASHGQRLRIAIKAVNAGAGVDRVSRALGWQEFEDISAHIFEENGFSVRRRFRFKVQGRGMEVDVVACRRPHIICAECKRWSRGLGGSAVGRAVEAHVDKVRRLGENLPKLVRRLGLVGWSEAIITPAAITLTSTAAKIYEGVPIIPILELPSFLSEFEANLDSLTHLRVTLPPHERMPIQTILRP